MACTMICRPAVWLLVLLVAASEIVAAQSYWTWVMPSFPGGALLGGAVTLCISQIMNEGRVLRDEQDLIV